MDAYQIWLDDGSSHRTTADSLIEAIQKVQELNPGTKAVLAEYCEGA